jgi:hypothetical protein
MGHGMQAEQSEAAKDATALLVLGMHRSGTSSVTGTLSLLDVALGQDLLPPMPDNPKGFFEQKTVVDLHDEILEALGTSWDDPRGLPEGWEDDPALAPHREKLQQLIAQNFGGAQLWAAKDPRLCRLLPLWLGILGTLNITPKIVFVVRNPDEVIRSLEERNETTAEQAAMLWLSYTLSAECSSRTLPRSVVRYEDWLRDWRGETRRLDAELALNLAKPSTERETEIDSFLDATLRHHQNPDETPLVAPQNTWVPRVHKALLLWRETGFLATGICDAATQALADAENAAQPITRYLTTTAQHDKNTALIALREHYETTLATTEKLLAERLTLINTLQTSTSWRITQPLRWLMGGGR